MIRTIIADDEHLIRKKLRIALGAEPDVDLVAECADGKECIAAVKKFSPDLLLLDVQMPGGDGFEVLRSISGPNMPIVVFVTAYDKYAIRAFEAHALDYVLKPFDRERLQASLARVRTEIEKTQRNQLAGRVLDLLADLGTQGLRDNRLAVRTEGRIVVLDVNEIDWIQAASNYVVLHAGAHAHRTRESIGNISSRLDPEAFVRIHRSIIVNVKRIKELLPCNSGEYIVVLKNGRELSCSRGYRASLQGMFERL
jgi:two-component system LytT family response regulator